MGCFLFARSIGVFALGLIFAVSPMRADEVAAPATNEISIAELGVKQLIELGDQGNVEAQRRLGEMFYDGDGVRQNLNHAVNWFRLAATQGDAESQFRMGQIGLSYPNRSMAEKWFTLAAEQGHQAAREALKELDEPVDPLAELRERADHGEVDAQLQLAAVYANGDGVTEDLQTATKWYQRAARQGSAEAQYQLARLTDDPDVEWYLMVQAANKGHADASAEVARLQAWHDAREREKETERAKLASELEERENMVQEYFEQDNDSIVGGCTAELREMFATAEYFAVQKGIMEEGFEMEDCGYFGAYMVAWGEIKGEYRAIKAVSREELFIAVSSNEPSDGDHILAFRPDVCFDLLMDTKYRPQRAEKNIVAKGLTCERARW